MPKKTKARKQSPNIAGYRADEMGGAKPGRTNKVARRIKKRKPGESIIPVRIQRRNG